MSNRLHSIAYTDGFDNKDESKIEYIFCSVIASSTLQFPILSHGAQQDHAYDHNKSNQDWICDPNHHTSDDRDRDA